MLDRIDSIEKVLSLPILVFIDILREHKIAKPSHLFDREEYFRTLREGALFATILQAAILVRLGTPNRQIQEAPRPVNVLLNKTICWEHRKLRRCLFILREDISLRYEVLQVALDQGWFLG